MYLLLLSLVASSKNFFEPLGRVCENLFPLKAAILQVVICSNHLSAQEEVSHALTHELIHAYDHCRGADLDWTNCEHHACSEIRAASLSGDCHFKQELLRGNTGFRGQHQRCVRRRAELSVGMNPHCKGPGRAKQAVEQTFEQCFADTAPFDRIP